ncbi:thioredoxin family protein [Bacteroidota bacterium]
MNKDDLITEPAILLYFTSPDCNVCKSLKPKVRELVEEKFPLMEMKEINIQDHPETAAEFGIFTIPVILVYFEGKEYLRKARNVGIYELEKELSRPYSLFF